MADILKAIVGVEVKGEAGLAKLSNSVGKTETALKKLAPATVQANTSMINLSRVVQDAPFGFIGIANNIDPLLQSFQSLKASAGSTGGALKALGASLIGGGGLALGVSLITSSLVLFGDRLFKSGKAAKEASEETTKYKESVKAAISSVAEEAAKVSTLVRYIQLESTSRKERVNAIKELQSIAPSYFATLDAEKASIGAVTAAYDIYLASLKRAVEAKVTEKQLSDIIEKRIELEKELVKPVFEEVLINGKLVKIRNAVYDADGKIAEKQAELNKLRLAELTLADKLAKLKPSSVTPTKVTPNVKDVKVAKPNVFTDFSNIPIDIEFPPENDIKERATKFSEIFYKESKDYWQRSEPLDLGLIRAVEDDKLKQAFKDALIKTINEGAASIEVAGFTAFGDAIGTAFSGGNLGDVFSSFANIIGSGVQEIGKQIIALSITAKQLKSVLKTIFTNPAAGIAVGVGLVAIGAAFKSIANKGVSGFRALGGPVTAGRSYVVGEQGREIFTPGVSGNIIPNNRLGSVSNSFGGLQVQGVLTGRGNDLLAVITSAGRSNGRLV